MNNINLISFVGPSGSGKSSAARLAANLLEEKGVIAVRKDVAEPLRKIQKNAYQLFGRPDPGHIDSGTFLQDPELLSFLAKHFEAFLGNIFAKEIQRLKLEASEYLDASKAVVFINADCRNNCYQILRNLDFLFIKIETTEEIRKQRLQRRDGKIISASVDATNEIVTDIIINNDGTLSELKDKINTVVSDILTKSQ